MWIYHILFTHSSTDEHLIVFTFGLLWIMLLWSFMYKFSCKHVFISLGYIPGSGFLGHMVILYLIIWETSKWFSKATTPFYISSSNDWVFQSFYMLNQHYSLSVLFISVIIVDVKWYLYMCVLRNWCLFFNSFFSIFCSRACGEQLNTAQWSFLPIHWPEHWDQSSMVGWMIRSLAENCSIGAESTNMLSDQPVTSGWVAVNSGTRAVHWVWNSFLVTAFLSVTYLFFSISTGSL